MAKQDFEYVDQQDQLDKVCEEIGSAHFVGLDTEFVSEDCYEPDLCLIQLAIDDRLVLIDPKAVDSVDDLWHALSEGDHQTIVHSGREELRFCLRATNKRLANLFDLQPAAGFVGMEFPAAYGTLVSRLLEQTLDKGETRTNWRTRPLSSSQIHYALQDVVYLLELKRGLQQRLEEAGRVDWFEEEMANWEASIEMSDGDERWRKMSGAASLSPRSLAVLRELWQWREDVARRKNRPARRILRDDLMVELSRRETSDPRRIKSVRGMERSELRKHYDDISKRIKAALSLSRDQWPPRIVSRGGGPPLQLLGQFLVAATGCFCRDHQISSALVGTAQDYREYAGYRLGLFDKEGSSHPALLRGWRHNFIIPVLDDLLDGKIAVRIENPRDQQPLCLEKLPPHS